MGNRCMRGRRGENLLNLRTIKYIWKLGSFAMRYPLTKHKSRGGSVVCLVSWNHNDLGN